jgi:undecaprenyl-phosphate galactose phosphotransferase/putative colanic acid biosynthesis UDP-glucose lipid carrier transferase
MNHGVRLRGPIRAVEFGASRIRISVDRIGPIVAAAELFAILLAALSAGWTYDLLWHGKPRGLDDIAGIGTMAAILYVFIARSFGLYQTACLLGLDRRLRRVASAWLLVMLLLTLFLFLLKMGASFSRGTMLSFGMLGLVSLLAVRATTARLLAHASKTGVLIGRRAIVLGESDELARLTPAALLRGYGISELSRVFLPPSNNPVGPQQRDLAIVDDVLDMARATAADEIVIAMRWSDSRALQGVRDRLRASPLPVRLLPDRAVGPILRNQMVAIGASVSVELQRAPLTTAEQLQKRVLDVVVATAAVVTLSPLMLLTALAIRLDSTGPVIFKQRRNGFNGQQFVIFKFRTMGVVEDGAVIVQAKRSDARITRIGAVLRRTSIDELPQLFNVIRGHMSLVGPRPHALAHDDQYSDLIANYAFRHHVKPGITGWAQVNRHRGETALVSQMEARVEHDLWYINHWSLWVDLKILIRTAFEVAGSDAAY